LKPKRIKEFLADAMEDPSIQPILLTGPPGVGKSAMPKEVAVEKRIGFVDIRLAQRDPTDLRGIPAVIDGMARWLPPPELPTEHYCLDCHLVLQTVLLRKQEKDKAPEYFGPFPSGSRALKDELAKAGNTYQVVCPECKGAEITNKGILFLDEITSCPPLTQASAYQLTLDKQIGEYYLPKGWYVMGAGNRIEDRSVVRPLSKALANRFTHIDFEVNLDDWTDWAINKGIDPTLVAFINFRSDLLFAFNPESSENAFPTPRSWEFVDNLMNTVSNKDILPELIQGTVGKGAAAEWTSFQKLKDKLPDLDKILAGEDIVPKEMDLKYALVSALVIKADPKRHFERLLQYTGKLTAEFSVLMVMMMVGKDEPAVGKAPSWDSWAKKHRDILIKKRS